MREILADSEALAQRAARLISDACRAAVAARGAFHLALAGGSSPRRCYEILATLDLPWGQMHLWLGDERCLPVGDAERNDTMVRAALLDRLAAQPQFHPISAELGPLAAAADYDARLRAAPLLDLALLGIGEDGHTASLFPGQGTLSDRESFALPVFDAPKPPPERISMGLLPLNAARGRIVLASGGGKCAALSRIAAGERLPAALLDDALWLLDRAAAGEEAAA